ncbi:hypothetical protein GF352_05005 [archaeon]|nr:hypothetical protein [archaeon]
MKRIILISLLLLSPAYAFIARGQATLSSAAGLDSIGFQFNNASITGNEGDIYYYEEKLWTNHPTAGLKKMSGEVSACDSTGYVQETSVSAGDVFCIKTQEGTYAKIRINSKTSDSLSFNWEHQRDGTNIFIEELGENSEQELDINYILIIIIVLLVIIIIILWKYH